MSVCFLRAILAKLAFELLKPFEVLISKKALRRQDNYLHFSKRMHRMLVWRFYHKKQLELMASNIMQLKEAVVHC